MWYQEVGIMRFNLFTLHARVNGQTLCTVYHTSPFGGELGLACRELELLDCRGVSFELDTPTQ